MHVDITARINELLSIQFDELQRSIQQPEAAVELVLLLR